MNLTNEMRTYISKGLCPCGCKRPVPNNRFWATDRCARRMNKKGVKMPVRLERKMHNLRSRGHYGRPIT